MSEVPKSLQWRTLRYAADTQDSSEEDRDTHDFSILQYNILADAVIPRGDQGFKIDGDFSYCKKEFRYMDSRHGRIIDEMKSLSADIVTFNEVEDKHFHEFLKPDIENLGYSIVCHLRSYDHIGMLICYKTSKFLLNSQEEFLMHESIKEVLLAEQCDGRLVQSISEYMKGTSIYPGIAQPPGCVMANLQCKDSGLNISVATTHITWKMFKFPALQILQAYCVFKKLKQFASENPSIVAGDFNSSPDGALYSYITNGRVCETTLERLMSDPEYDCDVILEGQGKEPLSVNDPQDEEPLLLGCDYIWYSCDTLQAVAALDDLPQPEYFPSEIYPSDHLPVYATLRFTTYS